MLSIISAMMFTLLSCFKKIIDKELEELKKTIEKEGINNEFKFNDNDGLSKTDKT